MKILSIAQPYGADVPIEKIECSHHLYRNFEGKIISLSRNSAYPVEERKNLNPLRFVLAAKGAKNHWKEQELSLPEQAAGLRKDLLNITRHLFGDHTRCRYSMAMFEALNTLRMECKVFSLWAASSH